MTDQPRYGERRSQPAVSCPRHPNLPAVSTCKRCGRGTCSDCTIYTEVGSICPECANSSTRARSLKPSYRLQGKSVTTWILGVTIAVSLLATVYKPLQAWLMYVPAWSTHEPWRLLTVALVHGGLLHLGLNMLTLYIVGNPVEQILGAGRYLVLYAASAMGGSLFVLAWGFVDPSSLMGATVGASGALFGLFAAIFVLQKASGADTTSIVILLAVNLAYGFVVSGISWQGHLGGLITGALVTWILVRLAKPQPGKTQKSQTTATVWASVGIFVALLALNYGIYWGLSQFYG